MSEGFATAMIKQDVAAWAAYAKDQGLAAVFSPDSAEVVIFNKDHVGRGWLWITEFEIKASVMGSELLFYSRSHAKALMERMIAGE